MKRHMAVCEANEQREDEPRRGRPKKETALASQKQVINLSKTRVTAPKTQTSQKSLKTQTSQKSQAVVPKRAVKQLNISRQHAKEPSK